MGNELIPGSGWAKAVEEVAKATNTTVQTARELGPFLDQVLGKPLASFVGMTVSDPLWAARTLSLDWLQRFVEETLLKRDIKRATRVVPPAVLMPLLSAAADQTNETLKQMWGRLLANAMDPTRPDDLRIQFIDTLRQFHFRDAVALDRLSGMRRASDSEHAVAFLTKETGYTTRQMEVSMEVLSKLGCVGSNSHTGYFWHTTAFGDELLEACRD